MASHLYLHRSAAPISPLEFGDAVRATCRPRFPNVYFARHLKLALAISGGVDSMALAYLTSALRRMHHLHVADNPISDLLGVIVDHQLRPGSADEARAVATELHKIGVRPTIRTINWRKTGIDLAKATNVESLARAARYREIGKISITTLVSSIFTAHHRDDQYETVLMRLLSGHGYRGLGGMRPANAIPECYEKYGMTRSGLLQDQKAIRPQLSFRPTGKMRRYIRLSLRGEPEVGSWDEIIDYLETHSQTSRFPGHMIREMNARVPYVHPLNTEDGGLHIYRPLIEFDKERLVATCEAQGIRWFEDETNGDRTLTTRNAVRYLVKMKELPRALTKDAVLEMSRRARRRVELEDAEAHRLLIREGVVRDFDSNAGTLLAKMPHFGVTRRNKIRRPRNRIIASVAVRKLIEFVTPERHLPRLSNLSNVVDWLFPSLASSPRPPRAFIIAGVLFDPVARGQWLLSRAPYPSTSPLPSARLHSPKMRIDDSVQNPAALTRWTALDLWDGRFWMHANVRVPDRFVIRPLDPLTLKPFRKALPEAQRRRLDEVLRFYAPGKVRYTLPALYRVQEGELTLLGLPSLGINVPGLERWVGIEASYKRVDTSLLGHGKRRAKSGYQRTRSESWRKRVERLRRRSGRRVRGSLGLDNKADGRGPGSKDIQGSRPDVSVRHRSESHAH